MPVAPKLYISYGMAKSGSTLAFELTRTILEMAGHSQERLAGTVVHPDYPINFAQILDKNTLDGLNQEMASRKGIVIIKTHSRLRRPLSRQLAEGKMIGQAICRDPRDIALSMLDAAREGRAWGSGPNGPYRHVRDTIPRIRAHVNHFLAWASCENILTFHYEEVAFDPKSVIARIAAQLGLEVLPDRVIDVVYNQRFIQKNRAVPRRWRSEMHPDDAALLEQEFSGFIGSHCPEIPKLLVPIDGEKISNSGVLAAIRRLSSRIKPS